MLNIQTVLSQCSWQEIASAFIVLFAVIDVLGSTPIIIDLKQKGRPVSPTKATLISALLLTGFFFAGDAVLRLFSVDIESFAVAGAFVIFLMVKAINQFHKLTKKKEEEAPAPEEPEAPTSEELLTEIRDLLKEQQK